MGERTGEVGERPGIHEGRPARQASVAERVNGEMLQLRKLAGFGVLALKARRFDVAAFRRSRENSRSNHVPAAHGENRLHAL